MKVNIGGDRLGSGNKNDVALRNYERSSHDLGYVWRSTMACGTLVPFMTEVGLPGDSFDINLNCDMKTHPTVGPLFGSYKVQLDVFKIPIRLYNGKLHMNLLGVGMAMEQIKLPQVKIYGAAPTANEDYDNSQINPSSLFSYLNIRGIGHKIGDEGSIREFYREFNAVPWLGYWDIYKNYYANKQEGIAIGGGTGGRGAVIHTKLEVNDVTVESAFIYSDNGYTDELSYDAGGVTPITSTTVHTGPNMKVEFDLSSANDLDPDQWYISAGGGSDRYIKLIDIFENYTFENGTEMLTFLNPKSPWDSPTGVWHTGSYTYKTEPTEKNDITPRVQMFDLTDIDMMRKLIMQDVASSAAFVIDENTPLNVTPYNYILQRRDIGSINRYIHACEFSQEGLGLKTYQSDLFNNWMSTEYIDGDNGINAITAVDTSTGSFSIDSLQLSKKVYDMLNRIAISGGSYNDWVKAVYSEDGIGGSENPIYCGGLSKELVFEEIFSNSESADGKQPLGTLAGKGAMASKHKGGKIKIRCEEPCYIMGIISLTPRLDYSQGNKWDVNLKTLDDFHKPGLDEIGFQDLITDQMAWWDTGILAAGETVFKSAGKQPAWLNYMTNVNQVRGNFARIDNEMFMTLNRRYEASFSDDAADRMEMADLTTYIDPEKFNYVFAETNRDAQNFWAQIKVDIFARRKMSAKIMPNL